MKDVSETIENMEENERTKKQQGTDRESITKGTVEEK